MNITFKKSLAIFLSSLILFSQTLYAAAVKSSAGNAVTNPESSNVSVGGSTGLLSEDKLSLIGEDTLQTQNYNDVDLDLDFSNYKKITLKRVILESLSRSNTLKAAKEKLIIQARIVFEEANNDYLPKVDFQLDNTLTKRYGTLEEASGLRDVKDYRETKYKVTLDQPIYSGGTTAISIKNKEAKYKEARFKYEIVVNQTIQKAIDAYFKLLFNMEKVEAGTQNMKKLIEIMSISQVKYDSGAISVGDLAAIKASVANAQTSLNNIKSNLADSIDYYVYLLNDDFKHTRPYEKNFDLKLGTYEELKEEIIAKNLGLINHRLNILSNKYKLKGFKADLKPKIDLQMKLNHVFDQEDFIDDEEAYSARFVIRYNIFNQGKDINKIVQTHSSIEELNYRYKEEIKKISWDTSKLYNSIKSLGKSLKSTKDEIVSSNEMVDVYWEGFQLGEQDLQILLQGQRQLDSANASLLKFKQDYLTNVFKVLNQTNELSSFFDIDPYDTSFIDYSTVTQMKTTIELNSTIASNDINLTDTIDTYLDVISQYSFDDSVDFKDNFLLANDDEYTVLISKFDNHYNAYKYIKLNRLLRDSFVYDYIKENGTFKSNSINKKVEIKTNVAHGIYKNKKEAQTSIDNMFDNNNSNKTLEIAKIGDIKTLYSSYVGGLKTTIPAYIIKPFKKKAFKTDAAFKKKFMEASPDKFTINIVSLSNTKQAQKLIVNHNIEKDSFVFRYGNNGEWTKVMFGVFDTYSQALNTLNNKARLKTTYHPIIEKVKQKQNLYNKYKNYNKIVKPKITYQKASKKEVQAENKKVYKKEVTKKIKVVNKKELPKIDQAPIVKERKKGKMIVVVPLPIITAPSVIIPDIALPDIKIPVSKKNDPKKVVFDPKPKKEILNAKAKSQANVKADEKIQESPNIFDTNEKNNIVDSTAIVQKNIPNKAKIKDEKKVILNPKPLNELVVKDVISVNANKIEKIPELVKKETNKKTKEFSNRSIVKEAIKFKPKKENIKEHTIIKEVFEAKPKKEILPLRTVKSSNIIDKKPLVEKVKSKKEKISIKLNNSNKFEPKPKKLLSISEIKNVAKDKKLKVKKEVIKKLTKNKKRYSKKYEEKFHDAPSSSFAIILASIPKDKVNYFVKRYILDDNYLIKKQNNTYKIIYGLYENKKDASQAINNLHPKIIDTVKVVSLESIR